MKLYTDETFTDGVPDGVYAVGFIREGFARNNGGITWLSVAHKRRWFPAPVSGFGKESIQRGDVFLGPLPAIPIPSPST